MKKRLLITSIVMMLVVAVALSTATYAWFTSNAKVEASSVTMTAAVNDAAAIGIAWVGDSAGKEDLVADDGSPLYPMVPATFTKNSTAPADMGYAASTIYTNDNGANYFFNAAGVAGSSTPYIWNRTEKADPAVAAANKFYVRNLSATTPVNITVTVNIADLVVDATVEVLTAGTTLAAGKEYYKKNGTDDYTLLVAGAEIGDDVDYVAGTSKAGEGAGNLGYDVYALKADVSDLVRVAIFTSDDDSTYSLLEVVSEAGGTNVSSGAIAKDANITSVANKQASVAEGTAIALKSNLAGNTNVYVIVHVWLDGNGLVDVLGGGKAKVAMVFDAAKA